MTSVVESNIVTVPDAGLLFDRIPYLPTCGNGKCKSGLLTDFGDYEWEQNDQHSAYFRCKCGRLYWRNRKEGRVLEVMPDGTTKPYMIWRSFRGWYPEDRIETTIPQNSSAPANS